MITRITYAGSALPAIAESIVLFDSTVTFGINALPNYCQYWLDAVLFVDANNTGNTLTFAISDDGVNWNDLGAAHTVAANDDDTMHKGYYIAPFRNVRLTYLNGAAAQTTFSANVILDDTSRGSADQGLDLTP